MEPALGLSRGRHPGLSAGCRFPTCEMGIHGVRLLKDDVGEAFKHGAVPAKLARLGPPGGSSTPPHLLGQQGELRPGTDPCFRRPWSP